MKLTNNLVCIIIGCILVGWSVYTDTLSVIQTNLANSSTKTTLSNSSSSIIFNQHHVAQLTQETQMLDMDDYLNGYHICSDSKMTLPFRRKGEGDFIKNIYYQCRGAAYEEFADKLEQYIAPNTSAWPLWGHRPFPIPANKKVLIIGNSHTRQTYQALMCQYQSQIDQAKKLDQWTGTYHFQNNSTMVSMNNSPFVHSYDWVENMESTIGFNLTSFDAILVGMFNVYDPETDSYYRRDMLKFSETHANVDFKNIPPPSYEDVARIFPGPLILFGMFDKRNNDMAYDIAERTIGLSKEESNRNNILFLSARVHIENIGIEAISRDRVKQGLCYSDDGDHRCVGPRGGHPDLLAWDFVEALYHFLE